MLLIEGEVGHGQFNRDVQHLVGDGSPGEQKIMHQLKRLRIASLTIIFGFAFQMAEANSPNQLQIVGCNLAGDEELIELELDALLEPENRPLTKDEKKVLAESLDESEDVEAELSRAVKLKPKAKARKRGLASTHKKKKRSKRKATSKKRHIAKVAKEEPTTPIPVMTKQEKRELLKPAVKTTTTKRRSKRNRNVVKIDFKE